MKGIVLAGGLGTRLLPLTKVTNKCLLPAYDRPMIFWPIQTLVSAGINDILLVCGGNAAGEFLRILGNGEDFGLKHLHYVYQSEPKGIAHALGLAEDWAKGEGVAVILADNFYEEDLSNDIAEFESRSFNKYGHPQVAGAKIFLKEVVHPEHYGCATVENNKVIKIIEKPKIPESNLAVSGLYLYDYQVWDVIKTLKPSGRGELEITDVNNYYVNKEQMQSVMLKGVWGDFGESLQGYIDMHIKIAGIINEQRSKKNLLKDFSSQS